MNQAEPDASLTTCSPPGCPFAIECLPRVLDDIRLAIVDAFCSLPRGGAEIGGLLLGKWQAGRLRIMDYAPLDCEHAHGPSFSLSANDEARLGELIAHAPVRFPGLVPAGWYHSHTRSEIFLSDDDLSIHQRFFPEPWQVALVLRPHMMQPTRAGFFFREAGGAIHASGARQEFAIEAKPVRPVPAGPAEVPVPEGRPRMLRMERNTEIGVPAKPVPAVPAKPVPAEPREMPSGVAQAARPAVPAKPQTPAPAKPVLVEPREPPSEVAEKLVPAVPAKPVPAEPREMPSGVAQAARPPAPAKPVLVEPREPPSEVVHAAPPDVPAEPPKAVPAQPHLFPLTLAEEALDPPVEEQPDLQRLLEMRAPARQQKEELPHPEAPPVSAPAFLSEPPTEPRRWLAPVLVVCGLAAGAVGYYTSPAWFPRVLAAVRPSPAVPAPPPSVKLSAIEHDGQIQINWDSQVAPVRSAVDATLEISDGSQLPQAISLDQAHLQSGLFTYVRQNERVDLKLILHQPDGTKVNGVTTFLGKMPERSAAAEDPEVRKERDELARQAAKLKDDLAKQAERTRKLEKDLKGMKDEIHQQQKRRMTNMIPAK